MYDSVVRFYEDRIKACPNYGFASGHEMLAVIVRCSFNDILLTDEEFDHILDLVEKCHINMMEVNYNEGW